MTQKEKWIVCLGILVADVVGRPVQSVPAPGRLLLVKEMVGLDVKAMRPQLPEIATKHLRNSRQTFLRLGMVVRSMDQVKLNELIAARDYEELDMFIVNSLLGTS